MAVSEDDLVEARRVAALVVDQLGDRYWPIFELIDSEIQERLQRGQRVSSVLKPQRGPGVLHQTARKRPRRTDERS